MNLYQPRSEVQQYWIKTMQREKGYWLHDGNINRPYALLTSGEISNFYANCSKITNKPRLVTQAAEHLLQLFAAIRPRPDVFCGSAYGAITLAYELARQQEAEHWFTIKVGKDEMELDRFEFDGGIKNVVMVEDVITTFKTTRSSIKALRAKAEGKGGNVLPYVFALVNRSGQTEIDGMKIISLIKADDAKTWQNGHNPFLGGPERVEPVRPKQHWTALNREYESVPA